MRTIKFRGQRVDTKEWVYGYYFIDLENKLPYIMLSERKETAEDWMVKSLQVIPSTVGQFTGMTDKNGNEIYEGDVVKAGYSRLGHDFFDNYQVIYKESEASFILFKTWSTWKRITAKQIKQYAFELIGNIHDNPELI